jgi:hypothetical protein
MLMTSTWGFSFLQVEKEILKGRAWITRAAEVRPACTGWGDIQDPPKAQHQLQELPVQAMLLEFRDHKGREREGWVRYAGPFSSGVLVIEPHLADEFVSMLTERLSGRPHHELRHWRLCQLSGPHRQAWVRGDGLIDALVDGRLPGDPWYDERLRRVDARHPMRSPPPDR